MSRWQLDLHQVKNGAHESLRRTKWQMIDLSELQSAKDGRIGVAAAPATTRRSVMVEPGISRVSINPEREPTTPD